MHGSAVEHATAYLTLLGEAINMEERIAERTGDIQGLRQEPPGAERDRKITDAESEEARLQATAASRLNEAIATSEFLSTRWKELLDAETILKEARDRLAIAEGVLAPKKDDQPE